MKLFFAIIIYIIGVTICFGQKEYVIYYFENGNVSSEGYLVNGKPDGFWVSYYENGILRSKGNRTNFELDSIWQFFDIDGKLREEISYKSGIRNGYNVRYYSDSIVYAPFLDGKIEGIRKTIDLKGKVLYVIPFKYNLPDGLAKFYNEDETVVYIVEYRFGVVINREIVNRINDKGLRTGEWVFFHEDGRISIRGSYKNDLRHGYFKEYSRDGKLVGISNYEEGILVVDDKNLVKLDIVYEYFDNVKLQNIKTFKNKVLHGLSREYDVDGLLVNASYYENGIKFSEGKLDQSNLRNGTWKEYYENGKVKGIGNYTNDMRTGLWTKYYESGAVEQTGMYNEKGNVHGLWKWFYAKGTERKRESFKNGILDGEYIESDEEGNIAVQGTYIEGRREFNWVFYIDGWKFEGEFQFGELHGKWTHTNSNGITEFTGSFIDGLMDGEQIFYFANGRIKERGAYSMGKKEGTWDKFYENGELFYRLQYNDDKIVKIDNAFVNFE